MADTIFQLGNPLAATILSDEVFQQASWGSPMARFMGYGKDAMLRIMRDLTRRPGDTIQYTLNKRLVGRGVIGFDHLEGKEERMQSLPDQFSINDIRHAVKIVGEMTPQRVPWDMREQGQEDLSTWIKTRMGSWWGNQLGGNVNCGLGNMIPGGGIAGDLAYCGFNLPIAPASTNQIYANSSITAESQLTDPGVNGINLMNLNMINRMVTMAETLAYPIRPLVIDGEPYYVLFMHPWQVNDLMSAVGDATWQGWMMAAMKGGEITKNPIFTGALGMFRRVIFHKDVHVPALDASQMPAAELGTALGAAPAAGSTTAGATNVARSIMCGSQAGVVAYGRKIEWPNQVKWVEESFDYKSELGIALELVAGVHKSGFTDDVTGSYFDAGVIVGSTYVNPPV